MANNSDNIDLVPDFNNHSFMGDTCLIPNMDKTDGNRGVMAANAVQQALIPAKGYGEAPSVFSRFENQIAEYGAMIQRTTEPMLVFKIFKENELNQTYILQGKISKIVSTFQVKQGYTFTEKYGYQQLNDILKYNVGDVIPKDTIISRSTAFDEIGNYNYGFNLLAAYIPWEGLTFEDPFVVSRSAANRMSHSYHYTVDVPLNSNDVIKNLLGTDGEFKGFADIGEDIQNGILCAIARINYDNIATCSDKNLSQVNDDDDVYYANGTVVKIEVFSNLEDEEKLKKYKYYNQINKYYTQNNINRDNLVKVCKILKSKGHKMSDDINYMLAMDELKNNRVNAKGGVGLPWEYNDNKFDTFVLRFTILETKHAYIGSKITCRYGDKGVISKILPDDQMPMLPDGRRLDIIINPGCVMNRIIIGTLYEHELNFVSDRLIHFMNKYHVDDSCGQKLEAYLEAFLKNVSTEQYEFLMDNVIPDIANCEEYWKYITEHGMNIHQAPFHDNINKDAMFSLYEYMEDLYSTVDEDFLFTLEGIDQPIVVANKFFIKLKHETSTKLSCRNAGNISTMKGIPNKNNIAFKKHKARFSTNPVR